MTPRLFSFITIALIHSHLNAQQFMNLHFEFTDEDSKLPKNWYIIEENGCDFALDSEVKDSGHSGFRIKPAKGSHVCSALILNELQSSLFKNKKRIKINAWVSIERSPDANLSLVTKQLTDSGSEIIKPVIQSQSELSGKQWKILHLEQDIDSQTAFMAFGLKTTTQSAIWIDKFELSIDDTPVEDSSPPAINSPAAIDLAWLYKNAIPIKTVEPSNNFEDLQFLQHELVDQKIIALGEVTHGCSEVYQLKHRLLRFLFSSMGYTWLAMEMDSAEARQLNNYVINSEGDPKKLLSQVSYWPWQTEEFLQLLIWMNAYNETHPQKIQIAGFDLPIAELESNSTDREQRMASNVNRIITNNPSSKIVLWAHNVHISKCDNMGEYVNKQYPFFSIAFALGNGSFNATSTTDNRIGINLLSPPPHDSYEYYLLTYNKPVCYVNLAKVAERKTNDWLLTSHPFRFVGSRTARYQFENTELTKEFDAILFIRNSTPSHLLFQH